MTRTTPKFAPGSSSSERASKAARGASRKRDTRCELLLRRELFALGLRYRVDVADLPGRPDIVFRSKRLAVFVDGDFWHGRDLEWRLARLEAGHNAPYWTAKIPRNVARDRRYDEALTAAGWRVLRVWETDVARDPAAAALLVKAALETADQADAFASRSRATAP